MIDVFSSDTPSLQSQAIDPILFPFIDALDEEHADTALARIFSEHTLPLIERILRGKRAGAAIDAQEANDLAHVWIEAAPDPFVQDVP